MTFSPRAGRQYWISSFTIRPSSFLFTLECRRSLAALRLETIFDFYDSSQNIVVSIPFFFRFFSSLDLRVGKLEEFAFIRSLDKNFFFNLNEKFCFVLYFKWKGFYIILFFLGWWFKKRKIFVKTELELGFFSSMGRKILFF